MTETTTVTSSISHAMPLVHVVQKAAVFPVEVRCNETLAYFPAEIKECRNGTCLVRYENGWRDDEWATPDRLRIAPYEKVNPADFNPETGWMVEVQAHAKENEPPCWWLATVKTCRGQMYMVNFVNCGDECNDILEKDKLRPVNKNPPLSVIDLQQKEIAIPNELWESIRLEDFESIRASAPIVAATLNREKHVLVLLGNLEALNRAELMTKVVYKHLIEIQALEAKTMKHQAHLQELKKRQTEGLKEEFKLSKELVGLVIGKKGKNIQEVEKLPGVLRVRVDSKEGIVRITAKTPEALAAARAMLEYTEDHYPIPASQVGRIVGKSFANLREIEKDSHTRIKVPERFDSDNKSTGRRGRNEDRGDEPDIDLVITGRKDHVVIARQLLDAHIRFLAQKQKLVQTERELQQQVRDLTLDYGDVGPKMRGRRRNQDTEFAADGCSDHSGENKPTAADPSTHAGGGDQDSARRQNNNRKQSGSGAKSGDADEDEKKTDGGSGGGGGNRRRRRRRPRAAAEENSESATAAAVSATGAAAATHQSADAPAAAAASGAGTAEP